MNQRGSNFYENCYFFGLSSQLKWQLATYQKFGTKV
jgi:hypothetical protein